jgi:glycosyltransferase involved in cell wall biosynthesis
VQWKVCLSLKGRCDIYIDQVTHGYGNNSIECWAMGIPVVTGWSDPTDRARFIDQTCVEPPFLEATPENLADQLLALIRSSDLREEYAQRGRAFAETFHSEEAVVKRLIPIYESAPPTAGASALRRFDDRARKLAERRGLVAA